ncbi:MAG: EAL domain-containing protein [Kofleriaceae bacterium]
MRLGSVTMGDLSTTKMTQLTRPPSVDDAIEQGQIYVDLQPVVNLETGEAFAYEALARCKVPAIASPLHLFAVAQEQRAISRLGRELRRAAVEATGGRGMLFVNVHPSELDDEDICADTDPLWSHQGRLAIEIPEGSPLVRYRFSDSILRTLRDRGVALALDDFGAGYSNFSYILQLDPDVVKIDRELITGATVGSKQQKLLKSLCGLCRDQGAMVIAEGIETESELQAVIASGIPLAQGYYLGRPSRTGAVVWKKKKA